MVAFRPSRRAESEPVAVASEMSSVGPSEKPALPRPPVVIPNGGRSLIEPVEFPFIRFPKARALQRTPFTSGWVRAVGAGALVVRAVADLGPSPSERMKFSMMMINFNFISQNHSQ